MIILAGKTDTAPAWVCFRFVLTALVFFDPGRDNKWKLNGSKNNTHRPSMIHLFQLLDGKQVW